MIVLQANMHRSRTADHLLPQLALEFNAGVVIISEQYKDWRNGAWFSDITGTAAIWIKNGTGFPVLSSGAERGFVWVRSSKLTIVSCYFSPNDSRPVYWQ